MTWDAHHRRTAVLRDVLRAADQQRDVCSADTLLDTVDGAREVFATDVDLLLSIHLAWTQRLSGQLDMALGDGVDDPRSAVVEAWTAAATAMPSARRLLDAGEDVPELAIPVARECVVLARSAALHGDLVYEGEQLRARAREAVVPADANLGSESRSLMARLRDALAA